MGVQRGRIKCYEFSIIYSLTSHESLVKPADTQYTQMRAGRMRRWERDDEIVNKKQRKVLRTGSEERIHYQKNRKMNEG